MSNKIKRFLLCLLAVSTMTVSGNIYADDTDESGAAAVDEITEDSGDEAAAEKVKRTETKEKEIELSLQDAELYLEKIGTIDGLDIYYKQDKIDDFLWEREYGEKPKKKDYTDEQAAFADKVDEIKKLGELTAFDTETGTAVASFESGTKCDDGKLFVSEAGRYIIVTDEEVTKPLRMRKIISSLDSTTAFLSADGNTLELLDDDLKDIDDIFTYAREEDGIRIYEAESGEFAWVSADMSHYYGAFEYGAESDKLRMIVDKRNAIFGVENLETGYIWWSSPLEATQDTVATQLLVDEMRSSNVMRYGDVANRSNNNLLRSGTDDCTISVSDIDGGIRVVYNYSKSGFNYPVEYTIEDDHLKASVKVSEIEETTSGKIITEMTVLGSFGAASDKEDGYFVIPDGSGALVRFNNNRTMQANTYMQKVYGSDVTVVPATKGAVTEQIYLPVYGIVKEDNAMLVVASKGDSNATLTTNVSKQSNSSYNFCNFTFTLRGTDSFYMSGNSNEKFTVFESGDIISDDIELLYYPIAKEDASYVDVAQRYRQYLLEEDGVKIRSQADTASMYVDLYGGVQKKRPILGIPVTLKTPITSYSQAEEILSKLKDKGVDDVVASYSNWTNDGIKNKVDTDAKPSGTLGGKSDFQSLRDFIDESGYTLYPVSDNRDFYSGNGYYSFSDTAVRVSGSYSRIVSYDRAYGIPDGFKKNMSLLSPSYFGDIFSDLSSSYSDADLGGISVANLTTSLYGDYGKKSVSRYNAMEMLEKGYEQLDSSLGNGILADSANAYALPYVSHITNVPLSSSHFDVFDEDIPFYQLVMHGVIPYSTTAINGDADSETLLLMAIATGSNLSYDMIYEETSELKDTEYDSYYYANYEHWIDTATEEYKLLDPILRDVSDSFITGYDVENDGNYITTTYENGTVVKVDLEAKTVDYNGKLIDLSQYSQEGGIRF